MLLVLTGRGAAERAGGPRERAAAAEQRAQCSGRARGAYLRRQAPQGHLDARAAALGPHAHAPAALPGNE